MSQYSDYGGTTVAVTKVDLEALVLALLKEKREVSVPDVAHAAGMLKSDEGDRKAIRRVLTGLVERGILEARGAARARVYAALTTAATEKSKPQEGSNPFKDIPLSRESAILLKYVSQSLQARAPVGYNQDFLCAYRPNQSFYLTDSQRAELLKMGTAESASGKDASEAQMILNHKGAIEYIIESAAEEKISSHEVCSIHALLSENLLGDSSASGRVRQIAVGIGGTKYMPLENLHLLRECFQIFIEKLNLIEDPFEQSFFALVQLSYMQAFEGVNKRTARLVANIPMIRRNLRPLSFIDVDNEAYVKSLLGVYEKNDVSLFRDLYMWAYARSAQRYSAVQQSMGETNLLKLKYRGDIQEIISLHDGNIARFKIRPSEFQEWKNLQ